MLETLKNSVRNKVHLEAADGDGGFADHGDDLGLAREDLGDHVLGRDQHQSTINRVRSRECAFGAGKRDLAARENKARKGREIALA